MTRPERIEAIMLALLVKESKPQKYGIPLPADYHFDAAYRYASGLVDYVDAKHPPIMFVDLTDLPDEGDA